MKTSITTAIIALVALAAALVCQSCTVTVTPEDAIRAIEAYNSSKASK